jgi:hypothetical protein
MITNIRKALRTASYTRALPAPTLGDVAPRSAGCSGQIASSTKAAAIAPAHCAPM